MLKDKISAAELHMLKRKNEAFHHFEDTVAKWKKISGQPIIKGCCCWVIILKEKHVKEGIKMFEGIFVRWWVQDLKGKYHFSRDIEFDEDIPGKLSSKKRMSEQIVDEVTLDEALADDTQQNQDDEELPKTWDLAKPPITYQEAIARPDSEQWIVAMETEQTLMAEKGVFDPVPVTVLLKNYKVGHTQHPDDCDNIYALVAKMTSICIILTYAAKEDLELYTFNV
ncbi:uncharacterized protein EV420DRAFT_1473140 [Desarmillaria tabescens]|uniref:Uncharacterized protein n=1 Tax=Armillaria tabescens TaxID=1929756 RepID=A0AA39NQJ9_ARMTA|nr:uncharacterized protein EV420DRAFT_1473140 [Desarmillaria tabescens]KAK0470032.1 hypothetical protein EV420DRAFT_1473140 [Desarmillaria tabescens]